MDVIKVVFPTVLTFLIGILITPTLTNYFYKYKMWKKSPRTEAETSEDFNTIHNTEHEVSTPRVGGVIIWLSVFLTVVLIYLFSIVMPNEFTYGLNFFSRSQTLVPLGTLFLAAFIGLMDDMLQIMGQGTYAKDHIVYRKVKIIFVTLIGLAIGLWFYNKLDFLSIAIPFGGELFLGWLFVPFFIIVTLGAWSTSVIDGLDGLAGGVLSSTFAAFAMASK